MLLFLLSSLLQQLGEVWAVIGLGLWIAFEDLKPLRKTTHQKFEMQGIVKVGRFELTLDLLVDQFLVVAHDIR